MAEINLLKECDYDSMDQRVFLKIRNQERLYSTINKE